MEAQFFWFSTLVASASAFGFLVRRKLTSSAGRNDDEHDLAWSQIKDNWLLCGMVWLALFSEEWQARPVLLIGCGMAAWWLAWRTLQRVRVLSRRASDGGRKRSA
jgi:hypothetical protein